MARKIIAVQNHEDVFLYWEKHGMRGMDVVHLDAHCDMYGLLINRQEGYCVEIKPQRLHEGNFLLHAVKHGMVRGLKWVYDAYGGRKYDAAVVKYETDLTGRLQMLRPKVRSAERYPIKYTTAEYGKWNGPGPEEHLDIDWDFFALTLKDKDAIKEECERFLSMRWEVIPEYTYVSYSEDYVHPSQSYYDDFIAGLSRKLNAEVERFSPEVERPAREFTDRRPAALRLLEAYVMGRLKPLRNRLALAMHKRGIF
jgi:hypothetical protein